MRRRGRRGRRGAGKVRKHVESIPTRRKQKLARSVAFFFFCVMPYSDELVILIPQNTNKKA